MSRVVLLFMGLLLLSVPASAQQAVVPAAQQPAGEAEATGPPPQEVVSGGTLPDDLLGRWLVVGWVSLPNSENAKTTIALWEVTREDAQIVFREVYRKSPERLTNVLGDHNAEDKPWRPTPEDLAELARAWDTLPETDPKLATLRNEIYGQDGFDPDFKAEMNPKNAIWAARQTGQFRRSAAPSVKTINVFGATEARDGGYAGTYTTATIAAAPFPIPIKLSGTFQMYRVSGPVEPPTKGFWSSLFSGCGK